MKPVVVRMINSGIGGGDSMMTKKQNRKLHGKASLRLFGLAICLIAASLSIIGGNTLAYLKTGTATIENVFTPVIVSGSLGEDFSDGVTKTKVHVENTGTTDIYVRLMLLPYWIESATDNPVGKAAWTPGFTPNANWFLGTDGCYYYKPPLEAGKKTDLLYDGEIQLLNNEADGTHQVLEILAQIIQCGPAVNEAWPAVTVDQNGNLTPANSVGGGTQ